MKEAKVLSLETQRIVDWDSFHDVFADLLGFPDFYGRNMNAWIDCLTSADRLDDGMMREAVTPGAILIIQIKAAADFMQRCPEQYHALLDCAAFVNYCRVEAGETPILALMLVGNS